MTLVEITDKYRKYWDWTEETFVYVCNKTGRETYKEPK